MNICKLCDYKTDFYGRNYFYGGLEFSEHFCPEDCIVHSYLTSGDILIITLFGEYLRRHGLYSENIVCVTNASDNILDEYMNHYRIEYTIIKREDCIDYLIKLRSNLLLI